MDGESLLVGKVFFLFLVVFKNFFGRKDKEGRKKEGCWLFGNYRYGEDLLRDLSMNAESVAENLNKEEEANDLLFQIRKDVVWALNKLPLKEFLQFGVSLSRWETFKFVSMVLFGMDEEEERMEGERKEERQVGEEIKCWCLSLLFKFCMESKLRNQVETILEGKEKQLSQFLCSNNDRLSLLSTLAVLASLFGKANLGESSIFRLSIPFLSSFNTVNWLFSFDWKSHFGKKNWVQKQVAKFIFWRKETHCFTNPFLRGQIFTILCVSKRKKLNHLLPKPIILHIFSFLPLFQEDANTKLKKKHTLEAKSCVCF